MNESFHGPTFKPTWNEIQHRQIAEVAKEFSDIVPEFETGAIPASKDKLWYPFNCILPRVLRASPGKTCSKENIDNRHLQNSPRKPIIACHPIQDIGIGDNYQALPNL